jgi:serine/threonine protein kinase
MAFPNDSQKNRPKPPGSEANGPLSDRSDESRSSKDGPEKDHSNKDVINGAIPPTELLPVDKANNTIISKRILQPASSHPLESDSSSYDERFQVGSRVGDYELVEFVGGGGMGRVFRARDCQLGRDVALKLLSPDQAINGETLERFKSEARLTARLDHENIAKVYFVGEEAGVPYIAFEFVEGVTIRTLVEQKGPLPLADAVSYTLQIVHSLDHAAKRDVVHRDVKPSNIMVTAEGHAKLIDLGLARLEEVRHADSDLTASGVTLGTFDYISPEQARDPRMVDIRSDLYSLGCTFFYMLTGRPPYPEGTVLQKLLQHQGDRPPDLNEFRPELPEDVSVILNKMMAKDPARRYQTPADLISYLQLMASNLGLNPRGFSSSINYKPRQATWRLFQQHLPWIAPVATFLFIVLALDWFWSSDSNHSTVPRTPIPPPAATSTEFSRDQDEKSTSQDRSDSSESPPATPGSKNRNGLSTPIDSDNNGPQIKQNGSSRMSPVLPNGNGPKALLTVGKASKGAAAFPTLAAAIAAAEDGGIIELCFNGRQLERPIALANKKRLMIRAGAGYEPIISFLPDALDPTQYPREIIALNGADLTIVSLAIELDIPPTLPADRWTLFQLRRGESIQLDKCSITIRNPLRQEICCFRVAPTWEINSLIAGEKDIADAASIRLADCVVRGQAVLLQSDTMQPGTLDWDNGLFVSTEPLLVTSGGDRRPGTDENVKLTLKHLTIFADSGLAQLGTGSNSRFLIPTVIDCSNSIVVVKPEHPMIGQMVDPESEIWKSLLNFSGDWNFYSGFDTFWQPEPASTYSKPIDFLTWRLLWTPKNENYSHFGYIAFDDLPSTGDPPETHNWTNYLLDDDPENIAIYGAGDGNSVGMISGRLPRLPANEK